jgi:hypothetical protein
MPDSVAVTFLGQALLLVDKESGTLGSLTIYVVYN